jgi:hypothetical protein
VLTADHSDVGVPRQWFGAFLLTWVMAAFASTFVLVVLGAGDGDTPTTIPVLAASLTTGWIVYALGSVVASRRLGTGDVRQDLGLRIRPVDLLGVPIGIIGQVAVVPAVYIPLRAIWPATFDDQALRETAQDLVDRADGALLPVLFVAVVIGAPMFEELLYRGLLQRPLLDRLPAPVVVVGVAFVFALIHFRPVEYPGLFAAGVIFGLCAWRTGRLGMAVLAHVGFNAIGLVLAL